MRFISPDPLGYPDGGNRYESYLSNPVANRDSLGLAVILPYGPNPGVDKDPTPVVEKDVMVLEPVGLELLLPTITIPLPPPTPSEELSHIKARIEFFNIQAPPWGWLNQCAEQSIRRIQDLETHGHTPLKHWKHPVMIGGKNATPVFGVHHVIFLEPKDGNPLPPVILDPFRSWYNDDPTVEEKSVREFRSSYYLHCGCKGCSRVPSSLPPPPQHVEEFRPSGRLGMGGG
ncbi:MAG: hypothetical protein ACFCVE_13340, partial [Phycisphaerae bacterium]